MSGRVLFQIRCVAVSLTLTFPAGCYVGDIPVVENGARVPISGVFHCQNGFSGESVQFRYTEAGHDVDGRSGWAYEGPDGLYRFEPLSDDLLLAEIEASESAMRDYPPGSFQFYYGFVHMPDETGFVGMVADVMSQGPILERRAEDHGLVNVPVRGVGPGGLIKFTGSSDSLADFLRSHDRADLHAAQSCLRIHPIAEFLPELRNRVRTALREARVPFELSPSSISGATGYFTVTVPGGPDYLAADAAIEAAMSGMEGVNDVAWEDLEPLLDPDTDDYVVIEVGLLSEFYPVSLSKAIRPESFDAEFVRRFATFFAGLMADVKIGTMFDAHGGLVISVPDLRSFQGLSDTFRYSMTGNFDQRGTVEVDRSDVFRIRLPSDDFENGFLVSIQVDPSD